MIGALRGPQPSHPVHHNAKVVIIGGGSLSCLDLLQGIVARAHALAGCHVVLMDRDSDSLELVYSLGTKLFQQENITLTLERTTSQEDALADATFVLTTFRTGGLPARMLDEKLPLSHNLIGHDTIGVGGFFYALRTAPQIAGIAAEMEKTAPKAFLLNYTNPSNIITQAIALNSGIRFIGISPTLTREIEQLAIRTNIHIPSSQRLYHRTVGMNHGSWTTAVWLNGIDVLPRIISWCAEYITGTTMTRGNYQEVMIATLTAHYQSIPSPYLYYYYFPERILQFLKQRKKLPAEELLERLPTLLASYQQNASQEQIAFTIPPKDEPTDVLVLDVLCAILNNTGEEWVLNVQNNGSIDFIEHDRIVELPCRVDARGATPFAQGDGGIAMDQRGLISLLAEYEGASAKAALWGSRRDAIKALAANPLVMSYSKAEAVYNDLARAHARYLPDRLLT